MVQDMKINQCGKQLSHVDRYSTRCQSVHHTGYTREVPQHNAGHRRKAHAAVQTAKFPTVRKIPRCLFSPVLSKLTIWS